MNNKIVKS